MEILCGKPLETVNTYLKTYGKTEGFTSFCSSEEEDAG